MANAKVASGPLERCDQSRLVELPDETYNQHLVLRGHYVLSNGRYGLIVFEFLSAVVLLGRFGKDFNNGGRVEEDVEFGILEFAFTTKNDDIRIGVEARSIDFESEVSSEGFTKTDLKPFA